MASPQEQTRNQPKGHGLWKDERRSPGYLPQGRYAPIALLLGFAVWALFRLVLRHHIPRAALGGIVLLIGLTSFWVAARMNEQRLGEERYIRGPGWWLGWLISKTSVPVARAIHIVMGMGICTLGILVLVH